MGIQLDEIEQDMIARITMLEAGAEPDGDSRLWWR